MTDKQREESAAFHLRKVKRTYEDFVSALDDLGEVMEITIPLHLNFESIPNPEYLRKLVKASI